MELKIIICISIVLLIGWKLDKINQNLKQKQLSKVTENENQNEEPSLKCPKCKHNKWYEGPGGGSFGNIECGNCKTRYNNIGPFGLQEIN